MNLKSIIKKLGMVMIGTGATQIINFVFGIVLVRVLTQLDYAVYKQGTIILNLALSFFFVISPISISYFVAKYKEENEKKAVVMNTLISLTIFSIIGSLLLFFFREDIANLYNNKLLASYMAHFALIIVFESISSFYANYLVAIDQSKKMAITTTLFSVLRVGGLLISLVMQGNLFDNFILWYVISIAIKTAYIIYDVINNYKGINYKLDRQIIITQIKFSLPIMFVSIINVLNANLDKNIIAMLYSPAKFAVYVNGAFEIPLTAIITTSITTIMLAEIAKDYDIHNQLKLDNIILGYRKLTNVIMVIMIPIAFSIFAFGDSIVTLLFSSKYIDCLPLFNIYLLMLVLKSFNCAVLITGADNQKQLVYSGIVMIACNAIFIFIVYHLLGFNYLTLAPVLATLVMNIMILYYSKVTYKQSSIFKLFPIINFFKICIVCLLLAIAIILLREAFNITSILSTIIFGPLIYGVMVLASGLLIKEIRYVIINKLSSEVK